MLAYAAPELGPLKSYKLRDVPVPIMQPGEVLVRVKACGVGHVDTLLAQGKYQMRPQTPYVPGQEAAGVIEAVSEGARTEGFAVGDRVFGLVSGALAELCTVHASRLHKLPVSTTYAQGAALSSNYLTAFYALAGRGQVSKGEVLLVFGAAGGLGSAAVQVGKALGLRVIGAASNEGKRNFVTCLGADAVLDVDVEGWRARLLKTCDTKPDVVFDPVCGPLFEAAFRSLAWNGRYLVVGFAGGTIPALPANLALLKGAAMVGVDVLQFEKEEQTAAKQCMNDLMQLVASKRLDIATGQVFSFKETGSAFEAVQSGSSLGKVIVSLE